MTRSFPAARAALPTRVRSVTDVTGHLRQIELTGPGVPLLRPRPGAHVVVRVPLGDGHARRVYSIWSHHPHEATLTLRVARHPAGGPGCDWAWTTAPGDRLTVEPPRSKITLDAAARFHVFAGDETGAVPLLAMRAALHRAATRQSTHPGAAPDRTAAAPGPAAHSGIGSAGHSGIGSAGWAAAGAGDAGRQPTSSAGPVFGVLESMSASDEVPGADGVPPLPWVHRGTASPVASRILLQAVRDLPLPAGSGTAYVAGEAQTCRLIQRHLVEERGWPRHAVKIQPQWAPGRPGFGAGTP